VKILIVIENFPKEQTRTLSLMKEEIKKKIPEALKEIHLKAFVKKEEISVIPHTVQIGIDNDPAAIQFIVFGIKITPHFNCVKEQLISIGKRHFTSTSIKVIGCTGHIF